MLNPLQLGLAYRYSLKTSENRNTDKQHRVVMG